MEQLKEFILWCKANKVKNFKNSEYQFELSELAFIDTVGMADLGDPVKEMNLDAALPIVDSEEPMSREDEDELLYWSTK